MFKVVIAMHTLQLVEMLPLIEEAFSRGQAVTLPVTGISMRPTLEPGDAVTLVAVDACLIERGDILLYRRENGQFVLHRAIKVSGETITFCGDAHVESETNIPASAVIARVVSYQKDGKEHTLEAIRAEGYRRLRSRPLRAVATWWHKTKTAKTCGSSPYRFVGRYLKRQIPAIVLLCVLSCVIAASTLGMALASGRVIDKALGNDLHNFRDWFIILFALLVVVATCNVLYSNIRVRACGKTRNAIRRDLFSVLLTKQYSALKNIHSGDILNHFTADVQIVTESTVTLIPQVFSIATKLVGGLAFLLMVEPMFTTILIVCGILLTIVIQFSSRIYKQIHKECQETEGKTRSYLQECIENMTVIKSFTGEEDVLKKLDEHQQNNLNKQIKRNFFANVGNTAVYTGFTFAYYAALAWGVLRIAGVIGDPMSVGTFAVLLQIMEQIRSPFRGASGVLTQVYAMLASAERLLELETLPSEQRPPLKMSLSELYKASDAIVCDDVSFAYEDEKIIFDAMSARFEKGKLTVIMGASGGGKSTLIKLLLGLIRPQSGRIVVETADGDVAVSASTRGLFAFVPQGNMILSGTLYDNITFGNPHVSQEAIDRAIRLACLEETIAALPQGLQTTIGERGVGLSEGQAQRVAIARALVSGAPILLLDECTSALDARTEKRLLASLRALEDRTVIFISHRTAVLDTADVVIRVQDRGMVVQ